MNKSWNQEREYAAYQRAQEAEAARNVLIKLDKAFANVIDYLCWVDDNIDETDTWAQIRAKAAGKLAELQQAITA